MKAEKFSTLPRRLLSKWVRALCSGEYKQGKYALKTPIKNEYCCLGVLREIEPSIRKYPKKQLLAPSCGIPVSVQMVLARQNDIGTSFRTIAKVIGKTL